MGSGRRSKEGETILEDNIFDNINNILDNISNIFDNIDDILNNIFVDTNHTTLCADLKIHISVSHFTSKRRIVTSLNSRLRVSIMLETQQGKEEEAEGGEEEEESITQKVVIMFMAPNIC